MILRIATSLVILLSVLFMPFWLSIMLVIGAMVYFSFFIEGVILLFLSDLLYGIKGVAWGGSVFLGLIIGVLLLTVLEIAKRKVKFYPS